MLYRNKSFTLPASAGHRSTCDAYGHCGPDAKNKCYRCGDKMDVKRAPTFDEADNRAIEYSKLRSQGLSIQEASDRVFGPASPLADDAIEPLTLSQEPV